MIYVAYKWNKPEEFTTPFQVNVKGEEGDKFEKNWSKKHTAWKCDLTRGEISTWAKSRE